MLSVLDYLVNMILQKGLIKKKKKKLFWLNYIDTFSLFIRSIRMMKYNRCWDFSDMSNFDKIELKETFYMDI